MSQDAPTATAGSHRRQTLTDFQSENAIMAAIGSDEDEFVRDRVEFGLNYAHQTRQDHELFVDAFCNDKIHGLESAANS